MTKWEKIEKQITAAFEAGTDPKQIARDLSNSTTFVYHEGPTNDGNVYAAGGANRLYQRHMFEGWNCRGGKVSGSRQMQIFA